MSFFISTILLSSPSLSAHFSHCIFFLSASVVPLFCFNSWLNSIECVRHQFSFVTECAKCCFFTLQRRWRAAGRVLLQELTVLESSRRPQANISHFYHYKPSGLWKHQLLVLLFFSCPFCSDCTTECFDLDFYFFILIGLILWRLQTFTAVINSPHVRLMWPVWWSSAQQMCEETAVSSDGLDSTSAFFPVFPSHQTK